MFVVLDEEVEQRLVSLAGTPHTDESRPLLELAATIDEDEQVISVRLQGQGPAYPSSVTGVDVPCYAFKLSPDTTPSYPVGLVGAGPGRLLMVGVAESEGARLSPFLFSSGSATPQRCEVEVVRLETDVFSRLKGIFDTRILASKTVSVVGLGSGGSVGAVELAKAGVGNFILVDFDRLKTHNVGRHVCGLADVGRFKTRAVRDAVLQHSPKAKVRCYEADVAEDGDLLHEIVSESDLVFVATDTELSRYLINEACLELGKPAVYGGAYERAFAGEVLRVIPGESGCYACVRQSMAQTMRSISSQQVFDYTDDSDFQAEPGLGLDVAFLAMIQTKVALMTLLRDTPSSLGDIDSNMIIWTNWARPEDGELFAHPMARYFVSVRRSKDCPACGDDPEARGDEEGVLP